MNENILKKVLELLNRLEAAKIHYRLAHHQEDAISIEVGVPGQRWEIDVYSSGTIDVEIFKSGGIIRNADALNELFHKFSD